MRMTMPQTNKPEIVSVDMDSPRSLTTGTSASTRDEDPSLTFKGFDVQTSSDVRAETKALARAIINKSHGEQERKDLLDERQRLLDKRLAGTLSQSEKNRYAYVLWTLDQIEDARHGAALDRLETSIARYESFLDGVEQLARDVKRVSMTQRKR